MIQLSLFKDTGDLATIVEGQSLKIWKHNTFPDTEDLTCKVTYVDLEKGEVGFWVINGCWDGILSIKQKNVFIEFTEEYMRHVTRWEFGDCPKQKKEKTKEEGFNEIRDDDIPF